MRFLSTRNVSWSQENDKEMVSNLLAFRTRLDVMVNTACDGNDSYRYKLKEAFEGFLNARSASHEFQFYAFKSTSVKFHERAVKQTCHRSEYLTEIIRKITSNIRNIIYQDHSENR